MEDETQQPTAAAIIALAGAPNAGKSTLLNRILGRRVSIATPKPQTYKLYARRLSAANSIADLRLETEPQFF